MSDDAPQPKSRVWLPLMLLLFVSAVVIGFGLVWLNVEQNNLAYSLRLGYIKRDELIDANAKLSNKVGALVAPHVLSDYAEKFGMHNAKPNQVWRLGEGRPTK